MMSARSGKKKNDRHLKLTDLLPFRFSVHVMPTSLLLHHNKEFFNQTIISITIDPSKNELCTNPSRNALVDTAKQNFDTIN